MRTTGSVSLVNLAMHLSEVCDLVSPHVSNHHKQVAYISSAIAETLGASSERQADIVKAALLHDVATPSLYERVCDLQFKMNSTCKHAEAGWLLLREYEPFEAAAQMVRYHHQDWDQGTAGGDPVHTPRGSQVLHLADRVSTLLRSTQSMVQTDTICRRIKEESGKRLDPETVDAFLGLAGEDLFWFDLTSRSQGSRLARFEDQSTFEPDDLDLLSLAKLFAQIVDFRSSFTATHSSGVAACAEALARAAGLPDKTCTEMRIAGFLHDLGKLGIPIELIEKRGPLNDEEKRAVRAHAYYTRRILENVEPLGDAYSWASLHHERMDGSGYPSRSLGESLLLPEKIMAVADTFIALTEGRPYRGRMNKEEALSVVLDLANEGKLDRGVTLLLESNFDEVYHFSMAAQIVAGHEYRQFVEGLFLEKAS